MMDEGLETVEEVIELTDKENDSLDLYAEEIDQPIITAKLVVG